MILEVGSVANILYQNSSLSSCSSASNSAPLDEAAMTQVIQSLSISVRFRWDSQFLASTYLSNSC